MIQKRKPLRAKFCNKILDRRNHRKLSLAADKISSELDIIRLLRQQMVTKIAQRTLFTKLERFLMVNQTKPFLIKAPKSTGEASSFDSSSESIYAEAMESLIAISPYYSRLVSGVLDQDSPQI